MSDENNLLVLKAKTLHAIFSSVMGATDAEADDMPLLATHPISFALNDLYLEVYSAIITVNKDTHGELSRRSASMQLLLNSGANTSPEGHIALQVTIELLFDHLMETTAAITRSQSCPHELSVMIEAFMKHFKMNMLAAPVFQPYMSSLPGFKTVFEAIAKVGTKNFFGASLNLIIPAGMAAIEAVSHSVTTRINWSGRLRAPLPPSDGENGVRAQPLELPLRPLKPEELKQLSQVIREKIAEQPLLLSEFKKLRQQSMTGMGHFLVLLLLGVIFFISIFNWANLKIPHFSDGENSNLLPIIFAATALFFGALNYLL